MLEMSTFVQVEDFNSAAYIPGRGFELIGDFFRRPDDVNFPVVFDERFQKNFTWRDLHACSDLRLQLWCLKPSDSQNQKRWQHAVNIIGRPATCIIDCGIDFAITVYKVMFLAKNVLVKTSTKIVFPFRDAHFGELIDDLKGIYYGLGYTGDSAINLICRVFSIFALVHFLPPKAGDLWSYPFYQKFTKECKIVLDANRVKFIREKCGWENVPDKVFREKAAQFSWMNRYIDAVLEYDSFGLSATSYR